MIAGGGVPCGTAVAGGWNTLVGRLAARARSLGVTIVLNEHVDRLPDPR
jgi:phytoene dehydrogenase-like protein